MLEQRSTLGFKDLNETLLVEALHRYVSRDVIEEQIDRNGVREKRRRKLGSVTVVFFILYSCLFRNSNRKEVLKKLIEGYQIRGWRIESRAIATRSALTKALVRLGTKVMRDCYESVKEEQKPCEESFYRGFRLKAYDGSVFNLEDSESNRLAYGKAASGQGQSAWPQVKMVMEIDVGTRQPGKMSYGGCRSDETEMVREMLSECKFDELFLLDRNLCCFKIAEKILKRGSQFLARARKDQRIQITQRLEDGSYLGIFRTRLFREGLLVRIIEYRLTNPQRSAPEEVHRLMTSLLDAGQSPAKELIELYHQRWEIEISFDELKNHLFQRPRMNPFFRSQRPAGVGQELYGLLILYSVIRSIMQEAAGKYDLEPRRLSFTDCIHILRRGVIRMQSAPSERLKEMYEDLLNEMAGSLLPKKENRINPRVLKKQHFNFPPKKLQHFGWKVLKTRFEEDVHILSHA